MIRGLRRSRKLRTRRAARPAGRLLEALICLGVFAGFGYYFINYAQGSSHFAVRQVAIYGLNHLDEQTVLRQSGISPDGNVFSFDEVSVASRVEELPFVQHCDVRRVYPDTIALHIQERVPYASLHAGWRVLELDREGVVLREYLPSEMPVEPFITHVVGAEYAQPGDRIADPGLHAALAVWEAFRVSPLSEQLTVSELVAMSREDIRMYYDEVPYEIRWGRGDNTEIADRLAALWMKFDGEPPCFEYVDLRFGEDVACK